jgi:hypothetical protein
MVPREQYNQLVLENPGLRVMPKELRKDLPPLPCDKVDNLDKITISNNATQAQRPAVVAFE